MKTIDGSTVSIIRHYDRERPTNSLIPEKSEFPKRLGRVSPKICSTQRVYIPPFSQGLIIA